MPDSDDKFAKPLLVIGECTARASVVGAELAKAIKAVGRVVEKHNMIPILNNVLMESDGATLKVTGTDLDVSVAYSMPATGAPFAATVNAALLSSLVNRRKDGDFGITATMRTVDGTPVDATDFALESGPSVAKVNVRPVGDFPTLDYGEYPFAATVPVEKLCEAFKNVAFAVSTEETRYYLAGVYLHAFDRLGSPILRMVAADGHRLARADIVEPVEARGSLHFMPGVIIPSKFVAMVLAIFGRSKKGDEFPPATVEISEKGIRLSCGSIVITSKLIDGTYPDYQRVIPCNNDKVMRVDKRALSDALAFVTSLSSERGKVIKCELAGDVLTIGVNNPDVGETRETVPCRYSGDPLTIWFNAAHVADMLAVHEGELTARFVDASTAVIWESGKGPFCLLMPVRV